MIGTDVVIIGAGASGLMCAIEACKRGRRVLILEHTNKAGKKILMSGGGRCNFTNYSIGPENYISQNPHFCKSALNRYTQWDFLALVCKHKIPFHEREHGQLFCNDSAKAIVNMLLAECADAGAQIRLNTDITGVRRVSDGFRVNSNAGEFRCQSLVVASGGLSIPKMGATPLGYQIAEQFGLAIVPPRAGLVPFTLQPDDKERYAPLSGIAVPCEVGMGRQTFRENLLFTHRGLSGPVILQISSYWSPGEAIVVNLLPDRDLLAYLRDKRRQKAKESIKKCLEDFLPRRLLASLLTEDVLNQSLADCPDRQLAEVAKQLQQWNLKPNGTEGYRTAEVTLGGVDCAELSSKTLEAKKVPGLYFIGEVVDVTGWLGGYNFQWAWSSGWCAGQYV